MARRKHCVVTSTVVCRINLPTIYLRIGIRENIYFAFIAFRDSHGVAQVRFVTGNKILRILKSKALAPDLPEDIYYLIKKVTMK